MHTHTHTHTHTYTLTHIHTHTCMHTHTVGSPTGDPDAGQPSWGRGQLGDEDREEETGAGEEPEETAQPRQCQVGDPGGRNILVETFM